MAPFDGSGNFALPPGSIAVTGTTIDAADHNVPTTDIAAALSQVLLRSGVAPMTGDLNMGGFSILNTGGSNPGLGSDNTWTGANTWTGTNTWSGASIMTTTTSGGVPLELVSTNDDAAAGPVLSLYRNSATPAANDIIGGVSYYGKDGAGNKQLYAYDVVSITDPTSASEDAVKISAVVTAGTLNNELGLSGAALYPWTNDGLSLGLSTAQWSDAFFASGAVLNFANGDVTVTHSSGLLTMAGGRVIVTDTAGSIVQLMLTSSQSTSVGLRITNTDAATLFDPIVYQQFLTGVTVAGTITGAISSPAVAYNTSSDYRLKENIRDLDDAGDILDAIQPRRFKWKGIDLQGIGFVAHELQEVVPEAVAGGKDAVDKDGSILPQGIDFSKLVPYLVAEIKALRARVAALEAAAGI